jgi:nitrite reductase (NADH) small subunit
MMITGDWLDAGDLREIPARGARTLRIPGGEEVALFRTGGDQVYALVNRCPHGRGPLSEGIVHGSSVTCPLHNWVISLSSGEAQGADRGCTPTIPVKLVSGRILILRSAVVALAKAA